MRAQLYKLEGAGNDFLLGIGDWARRLNAEPDLVRRLCDRRLGLGADGTLAIEAHGTDHIHLSYRNADGGEADFCANGTRCAALAAVELLGCRKSLIVETGWADIPAEVRTQEVSLELPPPDHGPINPGIDPGELVKRLTVLQVGVPHLVAATQSLPDIDLASVAPPFRNHSALRPHGANINLYEIAQDGTIAVRSWERGIEGETLSCGSGLVAVALVVMANNRVSRVELVPLSGDRLVVEALGEPPLCATRFTGPARFIAAVEPSDDLFGTS